MSSYGENTAFKLLHSDAAGEHQWRWQLHNTAVLSRVYPAPARVDSSNFEPQAFWDAGVQLVALNFQSTQTLPMQHPHGKTGLRHTPPAAPHPAGH